MMEKADQMRYAAVALAVLGLVALALWMIIKDDSATSMLLLLSGIGVIVLAILLYFFSPSKYLRADVSGALALSDTLTINSMLSALLVTSRGIHFPTGQTGAPKLFLPLSGPLSPDELASLMPGGSVFEVSSEVKGITISPPGRGLFAYAQSIGAAFTDEGLENEIKDVMENGLELAGKVGVRREGDSVTVEIRGLTNSRMCATIRKEDAGICARTCCPICSFVACMVAEGSNKKVMVESVKTEGGSISVTYKVV